MLAALAVTAVPTFSLQEADAATLAQLQMQSRAGKSAPRMDLCVGGARTPNCRAALDTAPHAALQPVVLRGRPQAQREFYSSGRLSIAADAREALPLKFNTDPQWKNRAKVMAREGLTFVRVPEGANHEFIVGINRHGMLGFSLKDTTGE